MRFLSFAAWIACRLTPEAEAPADPTDSAPDTADGDTADASQRVDADGDGAVAAEDCDDGDATAFPGAIEVCDGADQDCDGHTDDDEDGDGQGVCWDCDDADPTVYRRAPEHCDGHDEDCDGEVDEDAVDARSAWMDADGDGVGGDPVVGCTLPATVADTGGDCDDADATIAPGATDTCGDGIDQDCDGEDAGCGADTTLGAATAKVMGDSDELRLGYAVAALGDLDGDGVAEVGAIGWMAGSSARIWSGAVRGEVAVSDVQVAHVEEGSGLFLAGVGDGDGDGLADAAFTNGEYVRVYRGPLSGTVGSADADLVVTEATGHWQFGYGLVGTGDIDGDGLDDFAVGGPDQDDNGAYCGEVWVAPGRLSGDVDLDDVALFHVRGTAGWDHLGHVIDASDLDGDGVTDLLIPAYRRSSYAWEAGVAYVFLGPVSGEVTTDEADVALESDEAETRLGWSVATGDFDADGVRDVALGAPYTDSQTGAVHVYAGPLVSTDTLGGARASWDAEDSGDLVGDCLAGPGDMDGDGRDELAVCAPYHEGFLDAGAAYVLFDAASAGAHSLADAELRLDGERASDMLTWYRGLASAGDIDGDGFADLLVGATWEGSLATNGGAVYLVRGGPR